VEGAVESGTTVPHPGLGSPTQNQIFPERKKAKVSPVGNVVAGGLLAR
jgi:hypothetical protein